MQHGHETYADGPVRGIRFKGWTIEACKKPISNAKEIDAAVDKIGITMPEMFFGNNYLRIQHAKSGFSYDFNANEALECVGKHEGQYESVKVAYAKHWSEKSQKHNGEITDIVKPFDWTYTTAYKGDVVLPNAKFKSSNAKMPLEKLQRQDPILFYDEVVLFEDELADNGTALLTIKVRVMPTSFFVLQRFFLRVDDVLFRVFDTRLYHEFASFPTPPADAIYQTSILREYIQREDEHQAVVKRLPPGKDQKSQLTDPNLIATLLPPKFELMELLAIPK